MKENISLNLSNISTEATPRAQEALMNYSSPVEVAAQIRHTQVGRIGAFAALAMLVLYVYIAYKYSDDDHLQVLGFVTFALVEIFILALFRFNLV
jgi:hypothetical protein